MAYAPRRDFDKGARGGEEGGYDVFMKAKGRRKFELGFCLRLLNCLFSAQKRRRIGLGTTSMPLAI